MKTVVVIDYGMGNLHSVAKALEKVATDTRVVVTSDAEAIVKADRVVFPGVGAIRDCMAEIKRLGIDQVVSEVAATKPLLAVCVGMQALLSHSAENGGTDGLNILSGEIRFFADTFSGKAEYAPLKVPHMGWNQVHQKNPTHPMWDKISQDSRFYFVHSYYAPAAEITACSATTEYGVQIASALHHENIFATQFHPEKSAHDGLQLYANFLNWDV